MSTRGVLMIQREYQCPRDFLGTINHLGQDEDLSRNLGVQFWNQHTLTSLHESVCSFVLLANSCGPHKRGLLFALKPRNGLWCP